MKAIEETVLVEGNILAWGAAAVSDDTLTSRSIMLSTNSNIITLLFGPEAEICTFPDNHSALKIPIDRYKDIFNILNTWPRSCTVSYNYIPNSELITKFTLGGSSYFDIQKAEQDAAANP